ncbi:MAG: hypothetical protein BWK76_19345 [Desulfobulbaceae bacterium A2]|nr:MAG: hypothetical protein BWK76_19345 [Desulfobulbaceae bacterium A2]
MTRCIAALVLFAAVTVHAAGFDCSKAVTDMERQICADPMLAAMDELLAQVYAQALEASPDRKELVKGQKAWLAIRNSCRDTACLQAAYETRISDLACTETGSARGFLRCSSVRLKFAEDELALLEKQHARAVIDASNNPEHAQRVLAAESHAWRANRSARCALAGESEGGADEWKNAWALACEVDETKSRSAALRSQLGRK